jgi:Uma2 family endonuclease
MTATAQTLQRTSQPPEDDRINHFSGATWDGFERLLEMRGDRSGPRIAYLDGEIEIMSPSRTREVLKSFVGRLVETYCSVRGIDFTPFGAWTLKDMALECGLEPDECYVFGDQPEIETLPQLAIEVIWTSASLNKLEIYRRLGVGEVWFWRKGQLEAHVLEGEKFLAAPRSRALPDLDLNELASFLDRPTASQAMREYRARLEGR